jgi:hypothetical protein
MVLSVVRMYVYAISCAIELLYFQDSTRMCACVKDTHIYVCMFVPVSVQTLGAFDIAQLKFLKYVGYEYL